MKKIITPLIALLLSLSAYATHFTVTVTVTNIKKPVGNMIIGIFDNKKSFPNEGHQLRKISIPVTGEKVTVAFEELPPGEYAIAVCHDENGNNKCDRNLLGIPREGIAFSNNVKPTLRAPSFKDAKFEVKEDVEVELKLIFY